MTKTQELWKKRIEAWERSDISQKKYCKQNNISYSAFKYWRKKLGLKTKTFIELNTKRVSRKESDITIVLRNGIHIKINQFENISVIKTLVFELKELS